MSNVLLMSSWILTNLLRMEFTFKWPKNKFLGCFALILLVDVKAFPLARILSESENDLEEEFTFTLCGHATLFKELASSFPCFPVNREYLWNKTQIEKKKANSALQYLRIDFRSMMGDEHLNALSIVRIHRDIFFDYYKNSRHLYIQIFKEDAFN